MVLTFTVILLGLLLLVPPLKKNSFYMVHTGLVIMAAYYVESFYFTTTPFHPKTLLLFLVFQLSSLHLLSPTSPVFIYAILFIVVTHTHTHTHRIYYVQLVLPICV